MLFDYIKYLLANQSTPTNLSNEEARLLALVENNLKIMNDTKIINRIEELKKQDKTINIQDYGAGSKRQKGQIRSVNKIVKYASIKPKFGQLYCSIINAFNFKIAIEFGTSFGIGTSYLAKFTKQVITIEGCPETANIANKTFKNIDLQNVNLKIGEFSSFLEELKSYMREPIFAYIDGNHQYEATMSYFEYFRNNAVKNSILVFDDIYWSKEMKKAWQEISTQNYFTINLHKVGIVLLLNRKTSMEITRRF